MIRGTNDIILPQNESRTFQQGGGLTTNSVIYHDQLQRSFDNLMNFPKASTSSSAIAPRGTLSVYLMGLSVDGSITFKGRIEQVVVQLVVHRTNAKWYRYLACHQMRMV